MVDPETADVVPVRRRLDRFARLVPVASGVGVERVRFAGMTAEWLRPAEARGRHVLLYLHGGAYVLITDRMPIDNCVEPLMNVSLVVNREQP